MRSLIIIMPIGRKYIDMDFRLEDAIHQTVFLGDLTTPAIPGLPLQRSAISLSNLTAFLKDAGSLRFSLASPSWASGE